MALQIQKDSQAKTGEGNNATDPPKAVAHRHSSTASITIWPVNIRPL